MFKTVKTINAEDWSLFIQKTYGRSYAISLQKEYVSKQIVKLSCPCEPIDFKDDTNGASFKTWLERDPDKILPNNSPFSTRLWWESNFYPHVSMIINDLHSKGLLEEGDFYIELDW